MSEVTAQNCAIICLYYLAKLTVMYSMFLVQQVHWHYYCFTLLLFIDRPFKNGEDAKLKLRLGKMVGCRIYEDPTFRQQTFQKCNNRLQ